MKTLLLESKELLLTGIISLFILLLCVLFSIAAEDKKVYVSGDVLNVLKKGEMIISEGNSKAVSEKNIVKSNQMIYEKKEMKISANGNVEIYMESDAGEPVEAAGDRGFYYTETERGELYADTNALIKVKYFMKDSTEPVLMNSKEIYLDARKNTIKALKDVEIITSSGSIYSDNAFFSRDKSSILVNKDIKRPIADVLYDDKKGKFEADAMLFEQSGGKSKIKMRGKVDGKIKVEEKNKNADSPSEPQKNINNDADKITIENIDEIVIEEELK